MVLILSWVFSPEKKATSYCVCCCFTQQKSSTLPWCTLKYSMPLPLERKKEKVQNPWSLKVNDKTTLLLNKSVVFKIFLALSYLRRLKGFYLVESLQKLLMLDPLLIGWRLMCGKRYASFVLFSHNFLIFCNVQLFCVNISEYAAFDTQKDCYEVYALVPGLLREEVSTYLWSWNPLLILGFQFSSLLHRLSAGSKINSPFLLTFSNKITVDSLTLTGAWSALVNLNNCRWMLWSSDHIGLKLGNLLKHSVTKWCYLICMCIICFHRLP